MQIRLENKGMCIKLPAQENYVKFHKKEREQLTSLFEQRRWRITCESCVNCVPVLIAIISTYTWTTPIAIAHQTNCTRILFSPSSSEILRRIRKAISSYRLEITRCQYLYRASLNTITHEIFAESRIFIQTHYSHFSTPTGQRSTEQIDTVSIEK